MLTEPSIAPHETVVRDLVRRVERGGADVQPHSLVPTSDASALQLGERSGFDPEGRPSSSPRRAAHLEVPSFLRGARVTGRDDEVAKSHEKGGGTGLVTQLTLELSNGESWTGAFKPRDGQKVWPENPVAPERYWENEIVMSARAREWGLGQVIPETHAFVDDRGQLGSLQRWVPFRPSWVNDVPTQANRELLERLIAVDFYYGNADRHWRNIGTHPTEQGEDTPLGIDHGAILPEGPMPGWSPPDHMRANQADPRLLPSTRAFIDGLDPSSEAHRNAELGVPRAATRSALRRLFALKQDSSFLEAPSHWGETSKADRARAIATSETAGLEAPQLREIEDLIGRAYGPQAQTLFNAGAPSAERTRIADLVAHVAPGGLRKVGTESVLDYSRRLGRDFDPAASMAGDPIRLKASPLGVRVSAGQHRLVGLLERLGPDARIADIPGNAFVLEVEEPDEVSTAFHKSLPTMGQILNQLRDPVR